MTIREEPIEWIDMDRYSNTPMFNTKSVVQQTGVPAPTLRAWERRYHFILPERAENDYRLYSERDIVTIRWLKGRVDQGMTISQAIMLFQHLEQEHRKNPDLTLTIPTKMLLSTIDTHPSALQELNSDPQRSPSYADVTIPHAAHDVRLVQEKLIQTFNDLDESTASSLLGSTLAIYPVEQVCTELIVPTLWEVGQRWSEGLMNVSAEHFASNFFRGLLTNLFHVAAHVGTGPLILISCAPGESHELAALMLALFLRRRGMKVVYLGQSIEIPGLIQVIERLSPALVCISLTMPNYLSALIDLGRKIDQLSEPRPIFAFGGQAFCHYSSMISQISGIYLEGDLQDITNQLYHLVIERHNISN